MDVSGAALAARGQLESAGGGFNSVHAEVDDALSAAARVAGLFTALEKIETPEEAAGAAASTLPESVGRLIAAKRRANAYKLATRAVKRRVDALAADAADSAAVVAAVEQAVEAEAQAELGRLEPVQHDPQYRDIVGGDARAPVDDEDVVMDAELNMICPVSQKPFVVPVRNPACGHVYEQAAIKELAKNDRRRRGQRAAVRCPVGGCSKTLAADLPPSEPHVAELRKMRRRDAAQGRLLVQESQQLEGDDEDEYEAVG